VSKAEHAYTRLRLRALQDADLAFFSSLYGDAETMRHIGRAMAQREAAASFQATLRSARRPRGPRFFVIAERHNGPSIGLCSIQPVARSGRSAELGIMLEQGARGRQLARAVMLQLMAVAFETLSFDTLWVQYRSANVAAVRLFAGLGFVARPGARPRTARPTQCVRFADRSTWQTLSNQPPRGVPMSNTNMIGFLENVGRDAALRHASREQLLQAMQDEQLPPAQRTAVMSSSRAEIDALLGTKDTLYCSNFPSKPPKKAPGKKPGKAPPKKKPAKIETLAAGKAQRH